MTSSDSKVAAEILDGGKSEDLSEVFSLKKKSLVHQG